MSENDTDDTNHVARSIGPPKLTLVSGTGDEDVDQTVGSDDNVGELDDFASKLRVVEALLFASPEPVGIEMLRKHLTEDEDIEALLGELQRTYEGRGINLVNVGGKWAFRTAQDLSHLLRHHAVETRRLSKAALETLAIIAYHQPVTRAEIEEIRAVTTSVGTLDILLETGWARLRGRRRAPGRPVTYGTSEAFLYHFGLDNIKDLPGLAELKGAGLLNNTLPANFQMPAPNDVAALMPDEVELDDVEDNEDEPVEDDEHLEETSGELDLDGSGEDLLEGDELDKP